MACRGGSDPTRRRSCKSTGLPSLARLSERAQITLLSSARSRSRPGTRAHTRSARTDRDARSLRSQACPATRSACGYSVAVQRHGAVLVPSTHCRQRSRARAVCSSAFRILRERLIAVSCSMQYRALGLALALTLRQATLLDFGFSEARVNKALRETKNAGMCRHCRGAR